MIVVGLTGYKQAGKDSVAAILVRDYGFTRMAFAAPLKDMVKTLNPIVGHESQGVYCDCETCTSTVFPVYLADLYDEMGLTDAEIKKSEFGTEVRRLWERFGTDVIREMDEDFWVRQAMTALHESPADRIVFTDVRFENEADMIYDLRGPDEFVPAACRPLSSVWRIARPGVRGGGQGDHAAEQLAGLLGEEVTILNNGSLEDLEEPVRMAMSMLIGEVYPGQAAFPIDIKERFK